MHAYILVYDVSIAVRISSLHRLMDNDKQINGNDKRIIFLMSARTWHYVLRDIYILIHLEYVITFSRIEYPSTTRHPTASLHFQVIISS